MDIAIYNTETLKKNTQTTNTDPTTLIIYRCIDGVCTEEEGFAKIGSKYFLMASSGNLDLSDNANANSLKECTDPADAGELTSEFKLCLGENNKVDFPENGTHYLIYDGSTDYIFIRAFTNILVKTSVTTGMYIYFI